MFLSAAIASILLLGYSTTIPLLVGGCALMLASICTSYYHKWEQFKSLSSEETEQIKDKHKEKIQESLVYRIVSKVIPETILLVNLHQKEKSQQMKEELKSIKHLLRDKKSEVDKGQNNKMICNREEERNNKEKENKIGQILSNVKIQCVPFQKSIICQ
ncbi:MAG: hypothetical protein KTV77_00845 [Wolbachia endosymbiont of Fragariocoptes setiger]|nr:hypothetical protein [Wolbachia endosymbiont of Fragariocoptes setiger]